MNKKILSVATLVIGSISGISDVLAKPEFVIPAGATGCTNCHLDDFGFGFKAGVLDAFKGGLPGLKAFLHPTPIKSGDSKPILHPINTYWDVTVGGTPLVLPLLVSDAEDDMFTVNISTPTNALPVKGAILSQERTDIASNLPAIDFKWRPTVAQANQTYTVNFTAQEKGTGRTLLSNTVTATINVWPARKTATKNVNQFKIQRAQWSNNTLTLAGAVIFKNGLTTAQRAAALKALYLNMRTNSGLVVGTASHLTVDASGNWKKTVPFKAATVPCTVKLEYEGLNATSPVKLAPKTCLQ
ncbi:hypothetical protein [Crenothrix polyspora]|uniref:Uncharacterized protein n=1 Tax=Crenothrix polyspora TaxID=360316 RepID=A0A1R4H3A5_9GAMM|nr:hypothetical protein [Crenothrix polyspora]SJM90712.1 hypothetical protein CRENPOLYSF1_1530004 [Crenothrix polyspora]